MKNQQKSLPEPTKTPELAPFKGMQFIEITEPEPIKTLEHENQSTRGTATPKTIQRQAKFLKGVSALLARSSQNSMDTIEKIMRRITHEEEVAVPKTIRKQNDFIRGVTARIDNSVDNTAQHLANILGKIRGRSSNK